MGIEKSKAHARARVYWLVMYRDTEGEIKQCTDILEHESKKTGSSSPSTSTSVGVDFFSLNGKDFLLIVSYYSKYPEVIHITSKTMYPSNRLQSITLA